MEKLTERLRRHAADMSAGFIDPDSVPLEQLLHQAALAIEDLERSEARLIMETDIEELAAQGEAIERKHHKDIAELLDIVQRPMQIAGHVVPVASLPYTLTSDAGHAMAAQGHPFAACYWDTTEHRIFSLRSTDDGLDVSEIAAQFGGGGHKHAAGFRVPRAHELAKA